MKGNLTICPTPLGNLGDMTMRAVEALRAADTVCAEDTRVTGKLLAALGIEGKRLERLDENVVGKRAERIIERVLGGERIAYCTDAGMPGVSDPGLRLVRAARDAGLPVDVLPGPTAVATAYVASGCTNDSFYFGGFFPRKDAARKQLLATLANLNAALVFYESPNRLTDTLRCIEECYPTRICTVCREMTKVHEEVVRGPVANVRAAFENRESIKGEIVIVIDGPSEKETQLSAENAAKQAGKRAAELAAEGMRPKEITRILVAEFSIPRNQAYEIALAGRER